MVETMRAEGHNALVHTAAASSLGRMLVRICAADGIGLVNIVRRAEQARVLRDLGAVHVVDSSQPDFADRLTEAIRETGATLAFDAIGGGSLAGEIVTAMERAQPPTNNAVMAAKPIANTGSATLRGWAVPGTVVLPEPP